MNNESEKIEVLIFNKKKLEEAKKIIGEINNSYLSNAIETEIFSTKRRIIEVLGEIEYKKIEK